MAADDVTVEAEPGHQDEPASGTREWSDSRVAQVGADDLSCGDDTRQPSRVALEPEMLCGKVFRSCGQDRDRDPGLLVHKRRDSAVASHSHQTAVLFVMARLGHECLPRLLRPGHFRVQAETLELAFEPADKRNAQAAARASIGDDTDSSPARSRGEARKLCG